MTVMCLARLIGLDVDQTVACLVLAANSPTNVGADTNKNHRKVLDGILVRVQAAEDRKSTSVVDIPAESLKLGAQRR